MSQVLTPRTEPTGDGPSSPGGAPGRGRRSLVLLVVLLGLFFGAAAGWAAYMAAAGGSGETRHADAWTARLEAEAEHYARMEGAQQREAMYRSGHRPVTYDVEAISLARDSWTQDATVRHDAELAEVHDARLEQLATARVAALDADERRWEAQADRYAPGWRDQ
jgi:hypothetical protein